MLLLLVFNLILFNFLLQPIYGFASGGALQFKRAIGHRDLFYVDDKDIDFKDVRNLKLYKFLS